MLIVESALTLVLIWLLAICSLILGGCISACLIRLSGRDNVSHHWRIQGSWPVYVPLCLQKSDMYID